MRRDEMAYEMLMRGKKRDEIAQYMKVTKKALNGMIQREKRRRLQLNTAEENRELKELLKQMDRDLYWPSVADQTDWDKWLATVQKLDQLPRMTRVLKSPDIHFPDQNDQAIALHYQIAEIFQPDIILVGDDAFDFDQLSLKFKRSHRRKNRDAFKEVLPFWERFIRDLKDRVPNATFVSIGDNHGRGRVEKFIDEVAPMLGETLMEDYMDLVTLGGAVLWLGWIDEVRLGPALFEHGQRVGENSAKNAMKDRGWNTPRMGSHTHAPSWSINVAERTAPDKVSTEYYVVESVTTPCLCNVLPHYAKNSKKTRWVNGDATAYVNLDGLDVHFQNHIFHRRMDGTMAAVFGEHELHQKPVRLFDFPRFSTL